MLWEMCALKPRREDGRTDGERGVRMGGAEEEGVSEERGLEREREKERGPEQARGVGREGEE